MSGETPLLVGIMSVKSSRATSCKQVNKTLSVCLSCCHRFMTCIKMMMRQNLLYVLPVPCFSLSGTMLCHGWDQEGHCKLKREKQPAAANKMNIQVTEQPQSAERVQCSKQFKVTDV